MKNRVFKYISFFLALGLIVSACEKTDIQKANEAYDFNSIVPVVQGVVGPTSVSQTFSETYSVNYFRGGSTWSWEVTGATITATSDDTRSVTVSFPDDGTAVLAVTETTEGGKTSETFTYDDITVNPFCPMSRDDFLGTWSGQETGDSEGDISVTFIAGAGANEIVVEATDGTPGILSKVFTGWGETFQPGFGPEGDITLVVNENGSIAIGHVYWGQTLPGPYDYWYHGSGNWDGCGAAPSMSFDFNLDWAGDGGSNRSSSVAMTKQ